MFVLGLTQQNQTSVNRILDLEFERKRHPVGSYCPNSLHRGLQHEGEGLGTSNKCYWVSLLIWQLRNEILPCHLQFHRKSLPKESSSKKWGPCTFSISYASYIILLPSLMFKFLTNYGIDMNPEVSFALFWGIVSVNWQIWAWTSQIIHSRFTELKLETLPVISSKMQILGTFLTWVRVFICIIALEIMLFFSSFPPLSQHSPNSTRTSVGSSYHVRCCVHRQISQMQKSMQDLGLSSLPGQKQCPVQKKKKKAPLNEVRIWKLSPGSDCTSSLCAQDLTHLWGCRKTLQEPKVIMWHFRISCKGRTNHEACELLHWVCSSSNLQLV